MNLTEILKNLSVFIAPALISIGFAVLLIVLLYFLYYKKRRSEGSSRIQMKKLAAGVIFIAYCMVVLGLTSFSRSGSYSGWLNLSLFSGYVEAWNSYSLFEFQLIIFNILMFIPMGILLPLLSDKFKVFKWLFIAALSATLLIESFQLLTGRGIFELDDLFHNTLGSIIGYHIYKLAASIAHYKKVRLKSLIGYLAIPLIVSMLFSGMHIIYTLQEFGNMRINPSVRADMSNVELRSSLQLSAAPATSPVYKNIYSNNMKHGRDIAKLLQQQLGLPGAITEVKEGSNRWFLYKDNSGISYSLIYFKLNGTWGLSEDNYNPENETPENKEKWTEQASALLVRLQILPEESKFMVTENGTFEWRISDIVFEHKNIWNGSAQLTLKENGSLARLDYNFTSNQFVREVDILSPAEAYERIKKGDFYFYQTNPLVKGDQLVINKCELEYLYDTKGYYQPVYTFSGMLNGDREWRTQIEARRH